MKLDEPLTKANNGVQHWVMETHEEKEWLDKLIESDKPLSHRIRKAALKAGIIPWWVSEPNV